MLYSGVAKQAPVRRADGARTHGAILDAAMRLASVHGINGLTIGRLADELGISKSGLYAHFDSKLELQMQTIQAAGELFDRVVVDPAMATPPGIGRLRSLCELYVTYVERKVFPGGCFFASLSAEVDAQTGPVHDAAVDGIREWLGLLQQTAVEAKELGEIGRNVDVEQLIFELFALMESANYLYVLFDDVEQISKGRAAIERILQTAGN